MNQLPSGRAAECIGASGRYLEMEVIGLRRHRTINMFLKQLQHLRASHLRPLLDGANSRRGGREHVGQCHFAHFGLIIVGFVLLTLSKRGEKAQENGERLHGRSLAIQVTNCKGKLQGWRRPGLDCAQPAAAFWRPACWPSGYEDGINEVLSLHL